MSTILDHQLERQAIIEKIKNRLLELCDKKVSLELERLNNYSGDSELIDYHLIDIEHEICERIQDYHQMLYDFKEDWDLNYEY
jgi:hypothetical protein